MHWIDWAIIAFMGIFLIVQAIISSRYNKSVADFMAANRLAGRYVIGTANMIAGTAAISIIAIFQQSYQAGFAASWWSQLNIPILMILTLSGYIVYRYRETRAMTMAQFYEIRYGRRFRIFTGILAYGAGIVNLGIFPAVASNFFVHFLQLPDPVVEVGFIDIRLTYTALVAVLIGLALFFTFSGGQIAVLLTDFAQGFMSNLVMIAMLIFLLMRFSLTELFDGLMISKPGQSMVNPFHIGDVPDFNIWFFLIMAVKMIYETNAWQGNQGYNCSARNPHEQKMAAIINTFRNWGFMMGVSLLPLVAYMIMHHPDYAEQATIVQHQLNQFPLEETRHQLLTPLTMRQYLPVGLVGGFAAFMLAAFLSTVDTYLHSWGSILVQDVIIPFRKKPLEQKEHMAMLRWSVVAVAVFIFFWSIFFKQTDRIMLYFWITGAIYVGGAGAVIIGGLYTSWGTNAAAWVAMISGSSIAVGSIILRLIWKHHYGEDFPIAIPWQFLMSCSAASLSYIVVSLWGPATQASRIRAKQLSCIILANMALVGAALLICRLYYSQFATFPWTSLWLFIFGGAVWAISMGVFSLFGNKKRWTMIVSIGGGILAILLGYGFRQSWGWWMQWELRSLIGLVAGLVLGLPVLSFVVLTFLAKRHIFNLDKMLHRGKYAIAEDRPRGHMESATSRFSLKQLFGMTDEFTFWDKLIYGCSVTKSIVLFLIFVVMTMVAMLPIMFPEICQWQFTDYHWATFHRYMLIAQISLGFIIAIWLTAGSVRDAFHLYRDLHRAKRNALDDGRVTEEYEDLIVTDTPEASAEDNTGS